MGYTNRPDQASNDWENAPPGTTHLFRKHSTTHWMQWREGAWFFWSDNDEWDRDPRPEPSYHTPRPGSEAYDPRSEATHTRVENGRLYKPGPHNYARTWSLDRGWQPSQYMNTDLASLNLFTPIQRTAQSTEIVFTMTEEQSKAIALDKRPMKVVLVQFQDTPNAKEYAYWAPEGTKTGDFAVVHQSGSINAGSAFPFTVVKVTQDEVLDTSRAHKAILGTFDESFALHVQARIEHMTRVKAKLAQKKKAFEESAFYEMLAKSDPEAAALLDELKQFNL